MKKLLVLIIVCMSSCMLPYSSYNYTEPTRTVYYPTYYQPTRVIIVKQKTHKHRNHNNRHIKVKINKHRKTK